MHLSQDGVRSAVAERGVVHRCSADRPGAPRLSKLCPRIRNLTSPSRALQDRPYDRWLRRLLEHICNFSSNKDKAFSQFMIDLPEIPSEEIRRLCDMCLNPDQ